MKLIFVDFQQIIIVLLVINEIYLGIFSLLDPARPEVSDAVLKAGCAHIRIAMVTGDHPTTAAAIAKQVNILSKEISFDHGIDTFKIEFNNQPIAHLMRNTNTNSSSE